MESNREDDLESMSNNDRNKITNRSIYIKKTKFKDLTWGI